MTLKFYFAPYSTASATVAAIDELEHALSSKIAERIQLDLSAGDTKKSSYLSVNPNGLVPAIEHEDVAIWESAAIAIYLGETFGVSPGLWPSAGPSRGEAMKWAVWGNTSVGGPGSRLHVAQMRAKDEKLSQAKREVWTELADAAREELIKALTVLDGALKDRDYLLSSGYSLADTHVHAFVSYVGHLGISLEGHARVKSWAEKIAARPALKQ